MVLVGTPVSFCSWEFWTGRHLKTNHKTARQAMFGER